MSHALCPYPKRVHYNGAGDPAEGSSFSCTEGRAIRAPCLPPLIFAPHFACRVVHGSRRKGCGEGHFTRY
jgi:hypothetical protein